MVRRKLFRWRSGPRRHSRLVAKAVPSWARQVHMAGPGHSWKARWAVDVGPEKAAASTSALEMEFFLPDLVIPIRLTVTEDVASLSVPACLPARPPPPRRKAERNREPATVQQQVSDVPSETASEVSCGTTARTGSNARGISRRNCSVFLLGNSGRAKHQSFRLFSQKKGKNLRRLWPRDVDRREEEEKRRGGWRIFGGKPRPQVLKKERKTCVGCTP